MKDYHKPTWRIKRQRKPGRKPKPKPMTKKTFDEMRRHDDMRSVIRGSMTHEEFATKWNDHNTRHH